MNAKQIGIPTLATLLLLACGGSSSSGPAAPANVSVAPGETAGTAVVSFTAPTTGEPPTGYTVTASPGGHTATGTASPITVTGLTPGAAYAFSVVARNDAGTSAVAATHPLRFYAVELTVHEPMTQPNDSVFTGTFTFDATTGAVTNLAGSLTQAMTKVEGVYGSPMTTVALGHQLSAEPVTLGGVQGLLVTTFALDTPNTFDTSGFDPANAGRVYYGMAAGQPNPKAGGVGNAYAMIFVGLADPAAAIEQAQLDRTAYADCTSGGMMMSTCMTGTTVAGYGHKGTMMGEPASQVITVR